jgi:hypothetical protein
LEIETIIDMSVQLTFTDAEIKDYLIRLGYQIIEHHWIEDVSVYHNKTEEINRVTTLAIPGDIPIDNFLKSHRDYWHISPYRISEVFQRELKERLLKI